jgi:hypothetical protein
MLLNVVSIASWQLSASYAPESAVTRILNALIKLCCKLITAIEFELADAVPTEFVAVTTQRTFVPASADTKT